MTFPEATLLLFRKHKKHATIPSGLLKTTFSKSLDMRLAKSGTICAHLMLLHIFVCY